MVLCLLYKLFSSGHKNVHRNISLNLCTAHLLKHSEVVCEVSGSIVDSCFDRYPLQLQLHCRCSMLLAPTKLQT